MPKQSSSSRRNGPHCYAKPSSLRTKALATLVDAPMMALPAVSDQTFSGKHPPENTMPPATAKPIALDHRTNRAIVELLSNMCLELHDSEGYAHMGNLATFAHH
jgi:hypothetical protein